MRKLRLALLASAFLGVSVHAATVTTKTPLTSAAWTDLGVGPLMLSFRGAGVYAVADTTPSIPASEGFSIPAGDTARIKTASHVWAMATSAASVNAYSAPIVPAVSPNCAQAATYLARTTGGNEGGNALNIQNLICGLVSDGVITGALTGANGGCGTTLDLLYVPAQQNAADAALNLCGTSYTLTPTGTLIGFTPYHGWATGPSGQLATGFNPTSAPSPRWTLNSASLGVWAYAVVQEANTQFQAQASKIYVKFTDTGFYPRINAGGGSVPSVGTKGYYAGDRSSSAGVNATMNGTSAGLIAQASSAIDNLVFTIAFQSNTVVSAAHLGASLGPTLQLALYNRLRIYMTSIGVP